MFERAGDYAIVSSSEVGAVFLADFVGRAMRICPAVCIISTIQPRAEPCAVPDPAVRQCPRSQHPDGFLR